MQDLRNPIWDGNVGEIFLGIQGGLVLTLYGTALAVSEEAFLVLFWRLH